MANFPTNTSKVFHPELKYIIQENLLKILYSLNTEQIQTKVRNVIERNCLINKISPINAPFTKHQGILFEYSKGAQMESTDDFSLKLNCHESIQTDFMNCVQLQNQLKEERLTVSSYLARALNISSTLMEIAVLLPNALIEKSNHFHSSVLANQSNYKYSDTQNTFIQKNKQYFDLVNERLLTNILIE